MPASESKSETSFISGHLADFATDLTMNGIFNVAIWLFCKKTMIHLKNKKGVTYNFKKLKCCRKSCFLTFMFSSFKEDAFRNIQL